MDALKSFLITIGVLSILTFVILLVIGIKVVSTIVLYLVGGIAAISLIGFIIFYIGKMVGKNDAK